MLSIKLDQIPMENVYHPVISVLLSVGSGLFQLVRALFHCKT